MCVLFLFSFSLFYSKILSLEVRENAGQEKKNSQCNKVCNYIRVQMIFSTIFCRRNSFLKTLPQVGNHPQDGYSVQLRFSIHNVNIGINGPVSDIPWNPKTWLKSLKSALHEKPEVHHATKGKKNEYMGWWSAEWGQQADSLSHFWKDHGSFRSRASSENSQGKIQSSIITVLPLKRVKYFQDFWQRH